MSGQPPSGLDASPNRWIDLDASRSEASSVILMAPEGPWRERVAACFAENGFLVHVDEAGDVAFDGRALADIGVLALGLVARPALAVLEAWREVSAAPILVVADDRHEATVLDAYAAGADHVAPAGVSDRQLLARTRSVLRRTPRAPQAPVEVAAAGPIAVDAAAGVAVVLGTKVPLTDDELAFLRLLIERNGRLVTRPDIRAALGAAVASGRAVDFFVRRLREKLERVDGQRRIVVVRGVGFRFDVGAIERATARIG